MKGLSPKKESKYCSRYLFLTIGENVWPKFSSGEKNKDLFKKLGKVTEGLGGEFARTSYFLLSMDSLKLTDVG